VRATSEFQLREGGLEIFDDFGELAAGKAGETNISQFAKVDRILLDFIENIAANVARERRAYPAVYGPGCAHSDGKGSWLAHHQNRSSDVFGIALP
jgi:hypothetical protein